MKAVFLDRDGTINEEVDNLHDMAKLRILPGVAEGIRRLRAMGFLIIVVTNQPVVARGWITEREVEEVHEELLKRLQNENAKIDKIYYCPHHPNGNLKEYRKVCTCRKPELELVQMAVKEFSIDLKRSYFIGDRTTDAQTAKNAGIRSILLRTGAAGKDGRFNVKPDFVANNFLEAVDVIENP